MELDILEKKRKDKEEKEAQATKHSSVTPSSAIHKGKVPMEDVPQASVAQQGKALIHTSQQFKQKLTNMNSMLDTQEVATTQVVTDKQVNATVTSVCDDQVMDELKPLTSLKVQASSSPAHTIQLTNSDTEEGGTSHVPITKEVDNGNNFVYEFIYWQ